MGKKIPIYIKKISIGVIGLVSILLFYSNTVKNNIQIGDTCAPTNTAIQDGEELIYRAYYNWSMVWIPAGEIKFTVTEDSTEIKVVAIGKTFSSYDNFFRVNDYYESTIDKQTMLPKTFVRHVEEGEYRKFDSLSFDHASMVVHSFNGKNRRKAKSKVFPIDSCAMDLLSVMYSLRNTRVEDYNPGDYLDVTMFLDEEVFPIHVIYDKKEKKKVKDLGKFSTLKVVPELIVGNVFKEGDRMKIWVSNDDNRVPLLIESPVTVGSLKVVLRSHSGLRHSGVL